MFYYSPDRGGEHLGREQQQAPRFAFKVTGPSLLRLWRLARDWAVG